MSAEKCPFLTGGAGVWDGFHGVEHVECARSVTPPPLAMGVRFSPAPQSQCSSRIWQRTGAEHLGGFGCRECRVAPGDRCILIVQCVARFGEASRLAAATVPKTVCPYGRVGSTPTLSAETAGRTSDERNITTYMPVAEWFRHRSPKPVTEVRFFPGMRCLEKRQLLAVTASQSSPVAGGGFTPCRTAITE